MPRGPSYCVVGRHFGPAAAYRLRRAVGPDATITVFDPADRLGGILRTERVGGQSMDIGAEAFVARRPEMPGLLSPTSAWPGGESPTGARPLIYAARLHPLPAGTVNGIPSAAAPMTDLVDAATLAHMAPNRRAVVLARRGRSPRSVTSSRPVLARRWWPAPVDPMLSGCNAGTATGIGLRSAVPTVAAALTAARRT